MRIERFSNLGCLLKGHRPFAFSGLFVALCLSGCAEQKVAAPRPWPAMINVRPMPPASNLGLMRQPTRPRVSAPQAAESVEKPAAPSLAPQLSEQEIAAAQLQMHDSVVIAQKNLDVAKGRTLNPTQTDLASKVTSFLRESKDAVREGDWTRAKNLAKKAQLLSEALAASL